ncbi:MAG TPA: rhamnogalacturonan acetylesterase [Saprospiraceae bacterium]|nr:rhamnogalacturonan acetylesterase [Saprospiraceae bacterium]HPQ99569.1 rhamnogalacturonan acetylesterase [Saprospiraceae bacterium]HRV85088.1 rhamnogalacturonan acetylesterase [Saprospiraceae bacterium]
MNRFSMILFLLISLTTLGGFVEMDPVLTVYLIGDSTMADKPGTPEENPERGWGQLFKTFFDNRVQVENHAVNGRSSKSFLDEGRWDDIVRDLRPGDYVFIQFGHNDEKEQDPARYTNPYTGYRFNLVKFVKDTRMKGANPVLLSPIVRRHFNDQGTLTDTHGAYPMVCRQVADEMDVPFIDMQWLTERMVAKMGPEDSKMLYLWVPPGKYAALPDGKQDDTHLNPEGARQFAMLVIESIRALQLPLRMYCAID